MGTLCQTHKVPINFKRVTGCKCNVARVLNLRDLFSLCADVTVLGPIILCAKVDVLFFNFRSEHQMLCFLIDFTCISKIVCLIKNLMLLFIYFQIYLFYEQPFINWSDFKENFYFLHNCLRLFLVLWNYWKYNYYWNVVAVDCGPPPRLPLTLLPAVSSTLYGSTVRLQCEQGHQAYGDMSLRCLTNGRWSRLKGRCVRKFCLIIQCLLANFHNGLLPQVPW